MLPNISLSAKNGEERVVPKSMLFDLLFSKGPILADLIHILKTVISYFMNMSK
jgi:hypothetical protein